MKPVPRLPIIGVMGSGSDDGQPLAGRLGRFLAQHAVHLLTGGGGGCMASVSRAFYETPERRGLVIGILPSFSPTTPTQSKRGYPNPWVEVPIRTHLPFSGDQGSDPLSRNHINILSADAVIALAGGPGTRSEIKLAVRYQRPVVALVNPGNHGYRDLNITHIHEVKALTEHFAFCLNKSKSGGSPREAHN